MSSSLPEPVNPPPLTDRGYSYRVGAELYLVRHGESITNTYRNIVTYDPNLTALGWAQALAAGRWMAEHAAVDVVITSALRRAHSTALAIAHAQGLQPVTLPGIEEFSLDFWGELPLHDPFQPWRGRCDWKATSAEHPAFVAFRDRIHATLSEILTRYSGQRICLVSHGGVMNVITAAMLGSSHLSLWTENTGISHFLWPEWQRWLAAYINRREHLLDLDPRLYPRAPEATPAEDGGLTLPDRLIQSWADLPASPDLAFLSNHLRRSDRILFLRPPDPITPLRVSLRARSAVILHDDLVMLEAGELRRAALNANHIRYQYLFTPLPYPDGHFDLVVAPADESALAPEIARVLKNPSGLLVFNR